MPSLRSKLFVNFLIGASAYFPASTLARANCDGLKLFANDNALGKAFGTATATEKDYVAFGAPGDFEHGTFAGAVYLFTEQAGSLTQQVKLTADDARPNSYFGGALAASGETIIIGSQWDDDVAAFAGAAYIFRRTGSTWSQEAKLFAPDGVAQDYFGGVVAFEGNVAAITSIGQDAGANGAAAVYLFQRTGSTWSFLTKLIDPQPTVGGRFGHSLGVYGDWVAVGSNITDRACIYRRNGVSWPLETTLTAINPPPGDTGFGTGLAMNGEFLVVSSIHMNSHEGVLFLFKLVEGSWTFHERKDSPDGFPLGHFGWSVAMTETHLAVGADFSRKMFLYHRIGDQWRYEAEVHSSDPSADDGFGSLVAIGPDFASAGAPVEQLTFEGAGAGYAFDLSQCVTAIPAMDAFGMITMAFAFLVVGARLARKQIPRTSPSNEK